MSSFVLATPYYIVMYQYHEFQYNIQHLTCVWLLDGFSVHHTLSESLLSLRE